MALGQGQHNKHPPSFPLSLYMAPWLPDRATRSQEEEPAARAMLGEVACGGWSLAPQSVETNSSGMGFQATVDQVLFISCIA